MGKHIISIKVTERYEERFVVEANSKREALKKARESWINEDFLYEKTTACPKHVSVNIKYENPADENAYVEIS